MDKQADREENEVKGDTEREEDSSIPADRREKEDSEMVASDHESRKVTEEEPSVAEESEDLDVKLNEVTEEPLTHEESVIFESSCDDGPARLHLDTPERQTTGAEEEEEEEEEISAAADRENTRYEESRQKLQELMREKEEAGQLSSKLQMKLVEYFRKKAGGNAQPERQKPEKEQLQEYEKLMKILTDLQQQLTADSGSARQQEEQLRIQSQEKLDKVENEWRALTVLKQEAAVAALSRRLGPEAALDKVESTLRAEQLRQDELVQLRLKNIKLRMKIRRLEAEIRDQGDHGRDPLHVRFEQLQASRLEQKKHDDKQREDSVKLQKKISSSLELLSNIKEKLCWTQMEVEVKREQLAEVEALLATRRDLLTRTKQTRSSLQGGNLRLKERRGLLGNRVLLRDFQDTVDASEQLEEHLEELKCRQAEVAFSSSRWKKKLETT